LQHNEKELINAAANGCTLSFERLISPVESKMLSIAAGLASSPDEADDIFQEAMINAYRALPKFRAESQFATWLYRIVVNAAMDHHRSLKSKLKYIVSNTGSKNSETQDWQAYERYATNETGESQMHNEQLSKAISHALESLSPNERIAFVICHQQGLKMTEAAGIMHCSEGAVKNFLFRARSKMREQLKQFVG
jgi:RNA polymerase sigma-70 factor, ECF subfamily